MYMELVWEWIRKISGVVFVVCLILYLVRCAEGAAMLNLEGFAHFMQGLLNYIFK